MSIEERYVLNTVLQRSTMSIKPIHTPKGKHLFFAPEERYVYRTGDGRVPALQRSAMCQFV